MTIVDLLSSVRRVVCGAALYSPRAADLPVWGATVKVLYMTYCGKSESAAVPVGIALQQVQSGSGPRDRAAENMLCYM